MSKYLSVILGVNEQQLAATIAKLEQASGQLGVDIRLSADIHNGVRAKMSELGLDPQNTTGEELYHALQVRALADDHSLRELLKIPVGASANDAALTVLKRLQKMPQPAVWSLKRTTLKKLLSAHLPHKTMKALKYRSSTSFLKHVPPLHIYALACLVEDTAYREKLFTSAKSLNASDFELRPTEVFYISADLAKKLKNHVQPGTYPIVSSPEVNCVTLLHQTGSLPTPLTLLLLASVLYAQKQVLAESRHIKLLGMSSQLHIDLAAIAKGNQPHLFQMHDMPVQWSHAHHALMKHVAMPAWLGPHITDDDSVWQSVEQSLSELHEPLRFWQNTELACFVSHAHTISLQIIDVCLSALAVLNANQSLHATVASGVEHELRARYMATPTYRYFLESALGIAMHEQDDLA